MKKLLIFIITLIKQANEDDIFSITNDLTYKIILSFFPLIIFLFSILGFLDLDASMFISRIKQNLPIEVTETLVLFIENTAAVKSPSLLSTSLLFALVSASSGFSSLMKAVNKAYGVRDERNPILKKIVSLILVFVFVFMVVLSMVMLIFNNTIYNFIIIYFPSTDVIQYIFSLLGYIVTIGIMLFGVMLMNNLSLSRKKKFKELLPGSLFTVLIWLLASKCFNIYVNNFARYSTLYGSVGGIMILMIWVNIICLVLVLGSEINEILEVK